MSSKYAAPQDFTPAPAGTRVRWTAILVLAVVLIVPVVVYLAVSRVGEPAVLPMILVVANVPVLFFVIWVLARIRRYRFEGDELVVEIGPRRNRFPLAGLRGAEIDPQALAGALRMFGNGGLGSICGRFYSRRLGRFRAYVTDTGKAVVLRWSDATLVVSPDQPQLFLEAVYAHLAAERARR